MTYPISDLRSASVGTRAPTRKELGKLTSTLLLAYLSMGVGMVLLWIMSSTGAETPVAFISFAVVAFILAGVDYFTKLRCRHTVTIVDSTGQREILISKDKDHVHRIVNAINQARAKTQ